MNNDIFYLTFRNIYLFKCIFNQVTKIHKSLEKKTSYRFKDVPFDWATQNGYDRLIIEKFRLYPQSLKDQLSLLHSNKYYIIDGVLQNKYFAFDDFKEIFRMTKETNCSVILLDSLSLNHQWYRDDASKLIEAFEYTKTKLGNLNQQQGESTFLYTTNLIRATIQSNNLQAVTYVHEQLEHYGKIGAQSVGWASVQPTQRDSTLIFEYIVKKYKDEIRLWSINFRSIAMHGHYKAIQVLLDNGHNITVIEEYITPIILEIACYNGHYDLVVYLLNKFKIKPHLSPNILGLAAKSSNLKLLKYLCENKSIDCGSLESIVPMFIRCNEADKLYYFSEPEPIFFYSEMLYFPYITTKYDEIIDFLQVVIHSKREREIKREKEKIWTTYFSRHLEIFISLENGYDRLVIEKLRYDQQSIKDQMTPIYPNNYKTVDAIIQNKYFVQYFLEPLANHENSPSYHSTYHDRNVYLASSQPPILDSALIFEYLLSNKFNHHHHQFQPDYLISYIQFEVIAKNGSVKFLEILLDKGFGPYFTYEMANIACFNGHYDFVVYLLSRLKTIHHPCSDILTLASRSGNLKLLKYLYENIECGSLETILPEFLKYDGINQLYYISYPKPRWYRYESYRLFDDDDKDEEYHLKKYQEIIDFLNSIFDKELLQKQGKKIYESRHFYRDAIQYHIMFVKPVGWFPIIDSMDQDLIDYFKIV
ncbi:hypothetical protein DFA_01643 [Cavenderia fasciculata]|uniref:Ankyrin repeat-containing protein n=1 Tax=Cavenderia fasciculata TaxID=261658 RepID=F4PTY9_CACFS|nr:uncharacterized protein DFA_01643 [Cavenderia fasciculata]EGG21757.1 hypothetical protein DFA_01643 [Cavenderia fasciculata]|eukprot:XP_004359607.1 hypothetical protein DFA_01643 [Cavenderia fasciculata]